MKVIYSKDESMRLETIENSMNNICKCSEIKKIKDNKQLNINLHSTLFR